MNIWDDAYKMKLGERLRHFPNDTSHEYIIRVPGGWIYGYGTMQGESSVFIPYDNEFQITKERIRP